MEWRLVVSDWIMCVVIDEDEDDISFLTTEHTDYTEG